MTENLVGVAVYESETQVRKFVKREIQRGAMMSRFKDIYDKPINEGVLEWIRDNSLVRVSEMIHGNRFSDFSYFFQGSNGTLCTIHPKIVNSKRGDLSFGGENHEYLWRVNIRYQPIKNGLPRELTDAFFELGLERKSGVGGFT